MLQSELLNCLKGYVTNLKQAGSPLLSHPNFHQYIEDLKAYYRDGNAESLLAFTPFLDDKTLETPLDKYYFYQNTWAARKIFGIRPKQVVDVGSTALLVGIISQCIPTISIDIRPLPVSLPGLICRHGAITDLPFDDATVEFLSSMCVIEHVGLGRYGDTIDTQGSIKAFREVSRVIKTGGHFLFSVPLSHTPALSFNAHRIFSKPQVLSLLPGFTLLEEQFFYPESGNEKDVARLQGAQFCIWCVHMIKNQVRGIAVVRK